MRPELKEIVDGMLTKPNYLSTWAEILKNGNSLPDCEGWETVQEVFQVADEAVRLNEIADRIMKFIGTVTP